PPHLPRRMACATPVPAPHSPADDVAPAHHNRWHASAERSRLPHAAPRTPPTTDRSFRSLGEVSVAPDMTVALHDRFFRELPELLARGQAETPPDPRLLVLNEPLAAELGLDGAWLRSSDGLRFLVGNLLPSGAAPVAQAYAGHQFGGYVPR